MEPLTAATHRWVMHGIGMSDELPMIRTAGMSYDGVLSPGMTLCVEAYATHDDATEGVKLEEQVLVTETGHELLSSFPFESDLLD